MPRPEANPFYQQDILSADQFTVDDLQLLVAEAEKMKDMVKRQGATDLLRGKLMTALFYEPSSRTYGSFLAAMQRLGGGFLPLQGVQYSSVAKGETLPDTVRTFACYSDVTVIRHPDVGSAAIAAEYSPTPVINAGDGIGEHPTQALLDYFTIVDHFGSVDGLTVTMIGDLLNGRTVHSLTKLLALYPSVKLNFVSPHMLRFPDWILEEIASTNIQVAEYETLDDVLPATDVLYVTRVQKERFADLEVYEGLKHRYVVTPEVLEPAKEDMIVMHPLPRVGEIADEVDTDPRAVYIKDQMQNGMFMRMALLALILDPEGI